MHGLSAEKGPDQASSESNRCSNFSLPVFGQKVAQDPRSKTSPETSKRLGRMELENAGTLFVESTHWTAILDSISELKDSLEDDHDGNELGNVPMEVASLDRPELLFGGYKHIERQDILAAIPPRPTVDRLISRCFSSMEIAPVILHSPTFLDEYERFWDDPQEASVLWIGLLFGMMCLAVLYQQFTPDESSQQLNPRGDLEPGRQIQVYREKLSQCLIIGNYTRAAPFALYAHRIPPER